MEFMTLELSIDSILAQANSAFEGLLGGAMDMVSKITESMTSMF
jgi:hypothetical protein